MKTVVLALVIQPLFTNTNYAASCITSLVQKSIKCRYGSPAVLFEQFLLIYDQAPYGRGSSSSFLTMFHWNPLRNELFLILSFWSISVC